MWIGSFQFDLRSAAIKGDRSLEHHLFPGKFVPQPFGKSLREARRELLTHQGCRTNPPLSRSKLMKVMRPGSLPTDATGPRTLSLLPACATSASRSAAANSGGATSSPTAPVSPQAPRFIARASRSAFLRLEEISAALCPSGWPETALFPMPDDRESFAHQQHREVFAFRGADKRPHGSDYSLSGSTRCQRV